LRYAQEGIAVHDRVEGLRADLAAARRVQNAAGTRRTNHLQAQNTARSVIAAQEELIRKTGAPSGIFAGRKQAQRDQA
jgi:hypothetical protein